jgi:branched-chain amino acid transport system ATP-binding protein
MSDPQDELDHATDEPRPVGTEAPVEAPADAAVDAAVDAPAEAPVDARAGDERTVLLTADEVVAGYVPGVNILNGTNLDLFPGELVGIIGPNGAGKSTLVKALFGLLPVRSGQVRFHGQDITGLKAHDLVAKGIGYVPQTNNVFPSLSVEENLEMGTYLRPRAFAQRFEVVTTMFPRLGDRRKQRAGSLSGGERQMLSLGRALMLDPQVLLLDEPSAGLSPAYQDEVFINCRRINDTGVSIVMVEQNAHRCLQICHRGYVLDQGRNAYTNTGDKLLHDPKVIELYLGSLARVD